MSYAAGANQPKHYSWIVWDGNYWDDIAQFDTCGCSRLYPAPSGTAFNADVYDCEAMSKEHLDEFWLNPRLEAGTLKKADTLEALADMMEFDADQKATFLATVERYNGLVAAGEDTDFGKPAYRLSDVETAPFYAARIGGELLVTTHGVITDVNSRPLKNDGTPIEGLYVCGNDQGGFYPHNYPSNFTGINAGRTATRPHRRQARLGRRIGRPLAFPEPANPPSRRFQAPSRSPFLRFAKIAGRGR
ncbi:MAG: FAD-binding protein [Coriobacteriaceae bacterium]